MLKIDLKRYNIWNTKSPSLYLVHWTLRDIILQKARSLRLCEKSEEDLIMEVIQMSSSNSLEINKINAEYKSKIQLEHQKLLLKNKSLIEENNNLTKEVIEEINKNKLLIVEISKNKLLRK